MGQGLQENAGEEGGGRWIPVGERVSSGFRGVIPVGAGTADPRVPSRSPLLDSRLGWSLSIAPGLVGTCLSWGLSQG